MDRHPASARFHELLATMGELHDRKQKDYGRDDDPFANVRGTEDWGQPAWVGAMIRGTDKIKRLQTYARKGELANESVEDAFLDLAVYALIGLVLWEEEQEVVENEDQLRLGYTLTYGNDGPVDWSGVAYGGGSNIEPNS